MAAGGSARDFPGRGLGAGLLGPMEQLAARRCRARLVSGQRAGAMGCRGLRLGRREPDAFRLRRRTWQLLNRFRANLPQYAAGKTRAGLARRLDSGGADHPGPRGDDAAANPAQGGGNPLGRLRRWPGRRVRAVGLTRRARRAEGPALRRSAGCSTHRALQASRAGPGSRHGAGGQNHGCCAHPN